MGGTKDELTTGTYLLGGFMKVQVNLSQSVRHGAPQRCVLDFGRDTEGKDCQVEFDVDGVKHKDGTWRIKYGLGGKIHRVSLERI